jgi:hypothetical protein
MNMTKEIESKKVIEEAIIKEAVEYINEKIGSTYYKTAIDVGEYVLNTFFKDNPNGVKSRDPNKENSFSKLCERSDLKVHPKHLNQMVVVALQERLLINGIDSKKEFVAGITPKDMDKLGYSLKVELLKVTSDEMKITFAKHFIKQKFKVNQAREYIKSKLGTQTDSDIIPFSTPLIDQLKKISEWSETQDVSGDFSKLTAGKVAKIRKNIDDYISFISKVDDIKSKLEKIKTKVNEREAEIKTAADLKKEQEKKKRKKEQEKKKKDAEEKSEALKIEMEEKDTSSDTNK